MLAVVGGKGGCGKTTSTACLARALADRATEPVAVDADRDMPDLHLVTGASRAPGLDALGDGATVDDVLQSPSALPGVRVVGAGRDGSVAVETALSRIAERPDPVLVDTPAGASAAVAGPLRVADGAVLVSAPSTRSLTDAAKSAAMARALDAPVLGVVLTRSDGSVDPEPLLQCPLLSHVPDVARPLEDRRVREAYARAARVITSRNI